MEIFIEMHKLESAEKLKLYITHRFQSVFGVKQYMLRKISVRLSSEANDKNETYICCRFRADVKNQPVVVTEQKSFNTTTAIDLAMEHANLKLSHRINGNKEIHKRLQQKRNKFLYS